MRNFKRIKFDYPPAEAETPIIDWFLVSLDRRLEQHHALLTISDMKFSRGSLSVSWNLTGNFSPSFEEQLEEEFEWVCRRANQVV